MEIAPFRGLHYDFEGLRTASTPEQLTSPPYDVLSPEEHQRCLRGSAYNVTRLTLGADPGRVTPYQERAELLRSWVRDRVLVERPEPSMYVYAIAYELGGRALYMTGLLALGKLHPFADRVVLPHEHTFPKVVDDRLQLLAATRTHLESIFLLYSDPRRDLDDLLRSCVSGTPIVRVEAKPSEFHELYAVTDPLVLRRLTQLLSSQRPIIADGHHRYTTSVLYSQRPDAPPGSDWQLMTFANLHSENLAILATHRLVKIVGQPGEASRFFVLLKERLEAADGDEWDIRIESRDEAIGLQIPASIRDARAGVGRTDYAVVHDVLLEGWLHGELGLASEVSYFKEGTGEREALERGDGDFLVRMRPVGRQEFQVVVEGGEVFPHKTTYFYPKLWSGLAFWRIAEPSPIP